MQLSEPVNPVAAHVGIISAVSVVATYTKKPSSYSDFGSKAATGIVTACVVSARLHSIEWSLEQLPISGKKGWESPKCTRIQHPGEVVGNPVLLRLDNRDVKDCSLDLLVPSAEGGIFHFIRTPTSSDEWHMIGRIKFPSGLSMVSSLTCARLGNSSYSLRSEFCAYVQCGGRLYLIKTLEGPFPWVGCQLYPIEGPGPFLC